MARKRPLSNKDIIDMQLEMLENFVKANFIQNKLNSEYMYNMYGHYALKYHDEKITPMATLLEEQIKNFRELVADFIIEDLPQYQERKDIDDTTQENT